jgi:predicted adenine nucleotide alpha hydrolase (AANH) superfamily ATPase
MPGLLGKLQYLYLGRSVKDRKGHLEHLKSCKENAIYIWDYCGCRGVSKMTPIEDPVRKLKDSSGREGLLGNLSPEL